MNSLLIRLRIPVVTLLAAVGASCSTGDNPQMGPRTDSPENLFWATTLNHRGATMAIGQTLQLKATAINALGDELPGLSAQVTYTTNDTARAIVTTSGLVTARAVGTSILIVARVHDDAFNVTNSDTLRLNITTTVVPVTSFTIEPDSTLIAGDEIMNLTARAFGPGGEVPAISARYSSANQAALQVNANTGEVSANYLGTVKVWAVSTIYGTVWTDTVNMTVTPPIFARVLIQNLVSNNAETPLYIQPFTVTVRRFATVRFQEYGPTAVSVTFDNPGGVTGGNIAEIRNNFQERQFPNVGTFTYRVSGVDKIGTITVVE